jgi:hypothetical protein
MPGEKPYRRSVLSRKHLISTMTLSGVLRVSDPKQEKSQRLFDLRGRRTLRILLLPRVC